MQAVLRNWPWDCCLQQALGRFLLQVLARKAEEEAVAWGTTTILFLIPLGITTCHINNFISFIAINNSSNHNTIYNSSHNNLSSKLNNARKTFRK